MSQGYKFSTFSGVFVPSVLALLGAVMYYIAPQVLGGVGLLKMAAIIVFAHAISLATAFSISAIATNIHVKGGGLYYLISRSLGSEFGGSLGFQLFAAQTIGVAFYIIAFARSVLWVLGSIGFLIPEKHIALAACVILGIVSFVGARFVIRLQYLILVAIVVSIVSILLGPNSGVSHDLLATGVTLPFWIAFAMYFPAVTGIDAGVGMSGDLKNPRRSLVTGTFGAILFTLAIYAVLAVKMYFSASPHELSTNPFIIQSIAAVPSLVVLGALLATASSALSYFMSAPRTLRAMVEDRLLPKCLGFLAKTVGKENKDPRIAFIVSFAVVTAVVMIGGLELVAQIVSLFFLSVYGWINGAALFERISGNPSYRPSFNAPTIISFIGMIACYFVMYLFSPPVMMLVVVLQVGLFFLLYRSKRSVKMESVWDGVLFQLLRAILRRIEFTGKSKKSWRPTIVAFCANEINRTPIASLLDWIGANRSITKMYFLVNGGVSRNRRRMDGLQEGINEFVKDNRLELFPRVVMNHDFRSTVSNIIQSETLGNLPLNTVLLDFDERFRIEQLVSDARALKKNVIILRNQKGISEFRKVDVWWNTPANGNLMILLAYLITHSKKWKVEDAMIRIFKVTRTKKEHEAETASLSRMIDESRMGNVIINVLLEKGKPMAKIIHENSQYADLVLIGIPQFKQRKSDKEIIRNIKKYTEPLKMSLICLANDEIDFRIN